MSHFATPALLTYISCRTISDVKPRRLDAGSFSLLNNLAETVMRALEKEAFGDPNASCSLPPPPEIGPGVTPTEIQATDSKLDVELIRSAYSLNPRVQGVVC